MRQTTKNNKKKQGHFLASHQILIRARIKPKLEWISLWSKSWVERLKQRDWRIESNNLLTYYYYLYSLYYCELTVWMLDSAHTVIGRAYWTILGTSIIYNHQCQKQWMVHLLLNENKGTIRKESRPKHSKREQESFLLFLLFSALTLQWPSAINNFSIGCWVVIVYVIGYWIAMKTTQHASAHMTREDNTDSSIYTTAAWFTTLYSRSHLVTVPENWVKGIE